MSTSWKRRELAFLFLYAFVFYALVIRRSLHLSHGYSDRLFGLRPGWLALRLNDGSDAQWRNFRGNLPILTIVFGLFTVLAYTFRACYRLEATGMSVVWLFISLTYLLYLHGACVIFLLSIAGINFLLVKTFARTKYFSPVLWVSNMSFLICTRVYEGYSFSNIWQQLSYLDSFRGSFRWHICFNFVILRMISFGYDFHWAHENYRFDQKKHVLLCELCKSGKTCYQLLQERVTHDVKFSFTVYLCYLVFAPLYIAGPIIGFNAFASQLGTPQNSHSMKDVACYGVRWAFSLFLMELMTHFLYYNAFAISGLWKQLSPIDVFIIGYGVLNFMWLKFFLIWRYFRFWSLVSGFEVLENMPKCINNCCTLESFWKNWHASFNRWLVRYVYIPLGGSRRKLLNVWVVFTFVAIWHDLEWYCFPQLCFNFPFQFSDLESPIIHLFIQLIVVHFLRKLLSWAWLTCLFFIPEMILKTATNSFQVESASDEFIFREIGAVAGAITITCLMVANLVGFVIGPSGANWLASQFLHKDGFPVLGGMLMTFYVGTKLMFHIRDAKEKN